VGKILEIKVYTLTDLSLFKSYMYSLDLYLTHQCSRDLLLTFGNMLMSLTRCFGLFLFCLDMPAKTRNLSCTLLLASYWSAGFGLFWLLLKFSRGGMYLLLPYPEPEQFSWDEEESFTILSFRHF
jgi:hypothetical protein